MWVCREPASGVWACNAYNPTPALPKGEGDLFDAKYKLQMICQLRTKSTSHRPRAMGIFSASPIGGGGRRPEGGCLSGCRMWGVGCGWAVNRLWTPCYYGVENPHPGPPRRGGSIFACHKLWASFLPALITPAKAGVQDRVSGRDCNSAL